MTERATRSAAPTGAASGEVTRRLILVGDDGLAGELRARLPAHWQLTLVTTSTAVPTDAGSLGVCVGDGTSALVLERAGIEGARAVIAALPEVRANWEVCHLARRFDVPQVLALLHNATERDAFQAAGFQTIDVSVTAATALRNRLERASVALDGIGLSEGEIIQITVHRSSPAVGRALRSFSPQEWTVAAVFRDGQLLIPHGDTVLEAGDHLLLIGQPSILPAVAEYLRVGRTCFPLPYGTDMVALAAAPPPPEAVAELAHLRAGMGLAHLAIHVASVGTPPIGAQVATDPALHWHWSDEPADALVARLCALREVGCLCLVPSPAPRRPRWRRRDPLVRAVLRQARRPVLLVRSGPHYRRVVLPVAQGLGSPAAAEVAFDLSELVRVPLAVVVVQPPAWLREPGATAEPPAWVQELADVRRLRAEVSIVDGNPLHQILRHAERQDLVVLGSTGLRRPAIFRPDPLRYLAERLSCSTMLVPAAGG